MLPLAPDYYRRNFRFLIDFVQRYRAHLIDPELADFLSRFEALTPRAQCLYVRLLTRKGTGFRSDKLRYEEIGDPLPHLRVLEEAEMVMLDAEVPVTELGRLLLLGELRALPALRPYLEGRPSKGALLANLQESELTPQPFSAWWPDAPFQLVFQKQEALVERLQLLFFGNLHQSLSEFVVATLAHVRYPEVPLTPTSFPFQHADSVIRYQERERLAQSWATGEIDGTEWAARLRVPDTEAKLERQRQRHAFTLARQYEREGEEEIALSLYQGCQYGEARERRLRLYFARGDHARALSTALAMQALPQSEQERVVARRFLGRLARHLWIPKAKADSPRPDTEHRTLQWHGPVEEAVSEALRGEGAQVWHTENALINGVAGLLLWPVIHAPITGAFVQPFQHRPLDLYHPDFLPRRRTQLDNELALWRSYSPERFEASLLVRYQKYQGIRCALVQWNRLPEAALKAAIPRLSPTQWLQLVAYLMGDLKARRSGQPDLLAVNEDGLALIEVKGPGDTLRDHQQRWLTELSRIGVNSRLLWVRRAEHK